jgi:hypothetical protein
MSYYPPPSEVSHLSREELKHAQMAVNDANIQYEKNKEERIALMKAWIDPRTGIRRVFTPEKTQIYQNELNRINQAAQVLRQAITTAEKQLNRARKKIRNDLFHDSIHPEIDRMNTRIEYGRRPGNAFDNEYWFQTTSDEEPRARPSFLSSSDEEPTHPSFLSTSDEEPYRPSFLSSSDYITEDEEELPPPPDSPLTVPQPEEPPRPQKHVQFGGLTEASGIPRTLKRFPQPVIPQPRRSRKQERVVEDYPPDPMFRNFFGTPRPGDWGLYSENTKQYIAGAERRQNEAIQKRNELGIQLEQERQKNVSFVRQ